MTDNSISITVKTAKYIMSVMTSLVSHYFGMRYNPNTGLLEGAQDPNAALINRVNPLDMDMSHWLSSAISIMRLVAAIIAHENPDAEDLDEDDLLRGEIIDLPEGPLASLRNLNPASMGTFYAEPFHGEQDYS